MNRERTARARRVLFEQLERRVLLSADPVLDVLEGRSFDTEALTESSRDAGLGPAASGISSSLADSQTAEPDDAHRTTEVFFIDSRVPDALTLIEDLRDNAKEGVEIVLLDARSSGIDQVSETLADFQNLDAVHVISHGSQGAVQIGSTTLSSATLEYSSEAIQGWGESFAEGGDLLFYGCDLAATEAGQELVDALARLTETDVSASEDPTGAASLGGDWNLEYQRGNVESRVAFSAEMQRDYANVLADSGESLWISTEQDVPSPSGWNGLATEAIGASEILSLGGPSLALEPGIGATDGTFSRVVDFDPMVSAGSSRINALHHVGRELTVGDNAVNLSRGDVLFSLFEASTTTLQNSDLTTLDVQRNDIVLFRPDTPGNYTSGTYSVLVDGADLGINSLTGFTLVEQSTTVGQGGGATTIDAGDILFVDWNAVAGDAHIQRLQPGTLGDNTSGATSVLVDGNDLSTDLSLSSVAGLDLVEEDTTIGGSVLHSGQILLTLPGTDDIGGITAGEHDIVVLDVTTTGMNSTATATLLFDGSEVGLNDWQEDIRGLTLVVTPVNDAPIMAATALDPNFSEGGSVANLFSGVSIDTVESGQTVAQLVLTVTNVTDGADEILTIDGTAIALTHANSGSTTSNGYGYTVSIAGNTATVVLATTGATPAAIETAVDAMSYQNNGRPPTIADRVVTLVSVKDSGGTGGGDNDTGTPNIASTVKVSASGPALWLSTDSNVVAPGADGLPSGWTEGQVLALGGPDLALGDPTDGDLSSVVDFDNFTLDAVDAGALHFVSRDITVGGGANTFDLMSGDVLVSFLQPETILAAYTISGSDESYTDRDLLVFRPAGFDDYSTGTFHLLLDEVVGDDLKGLTLVEQDTTIGGTPISAGSFLIIQETSATTSIDLFMPTGVGAGTTSGTTTPLIDLSDLGIDANRLRGLELIEAETEIGGQTLAAGSLLATLNVDDNVSGVGSNNLLVDMQDVFVLNLTATGLGTTAGTAAMVLDGDDVKLDGTGGAESPYALALKNYSQLTVDTTSDVSDGDTSSLVALLQNKGADGKISLHEAIEAANAPPNGDIDDTIVFNIPLDDLKHFYYQDDGVGGQVTLTNTAATTLPDGSIVDIDPDFAKSWFSIQVGGGLPSISEALVIDGTTQTGFADTPIIELDGNAAGAGINGLTITAGSSTIRGLAINQFGGDGVHITTGNGNLIEGNYIGTDVSGTLDLGNAVAGIFITGGASSNTIGGLTGAHRNVISGNNDDGLKIEATAGSGNTVIGNYIGLDVSGTSELGNAGSGVDVQADGNTIGGSAAEARNISSGNTFNGVVVSGSGNTVQGNYFGTDANGNAVFGNGKNGVWINGGSNNLIGGTAAGAGNLVAANTWDGIRISGGTATGNGILGNVIHSNTGLAVDLGADGVTGNDTDPDDVDGGANNLQNFPVIAAAELSGTDLTLSGSLDTDGINKQYRIEFFGNAAGTQDASNGEGRYYLDATTVTTDGSGDAVFSNVTLSGITLGVGDFVTATATLIDDPAQVGIDDQLAYGSTSEFAANVAINRVPAAVADGYSTAEDTAVTTGNVLTNDDLGDEPTTITAFGATSVNGGTVVNNGNGTFTYTPVGNFHGSDSFTYTITDLDGETSTATVTITVSNVDDGAPVATDDAGASFNTSEDVIGFITGNVLSNDTLSDHAAITAFDATSAQGGTVVDNGNGTFTYTPVAEFNGTDTFTYTLTDDEGETDTATVTIVVSNVNDAPIARPDGVHLSFDGDDFVRVADAPSLQMTTTVTMEAWINHNGGGTGSQLIFNKEGEYELGVTADTGEIKFAIADAGGTWSWHNTGYFITVGEWTHVAVTYDGVAGEAKTYINGTVVETHSQSGSIGDVYPGFNDLFIGGRENASTQRFQGQIDEVRVWSTARSQGEILSSMYGSLAGFEPGLAGNWRLDEAAGGTVIDQSPFGNDGILGGGEGAPATPAYQGYVTDENSLLTIPAGSGLLANDLDVDSGSLTVTNVDTTGMLGSLVMNTADGSFTYDPRFAFEHLAFGEQITETFTYTANDGFSDSNTATVSITVTGVNDSPAVSVTATNPTFTEGGAAADLFNAVSIGTVESGQSIDQIVLTVSNVIDGSDEILNIDGSGVALTNANSGTTTNNSYGYTVTLAGDTATVVLTTTGATPVATQTVVDTLSYQNNGTPPTVVNRVVTLLSVQDGGGIANGGSDTVVSSIASTVSVDLVPSAANDTDTATEAGVAVGGNVITNDTPGDAPTTVTAANQGGNAITVGSAFATSAGGSLTLNSNGSYTYTPPLEGSVPPGGLTEVFFYTITDADGDPSSATLTITVSDSDLTPSAVNDTNNATEAGAAIGGNVITNDSPGDAPTTVTAANQGGNAITVGSAFATSAGGLLTLNSNGSYTYAPPAQGAVPPSGLVEVFTYTITDANGDIASAKLIITVVDNDQTPSAVNDTATAIEDTVLTSGNVLANDNLGDEPATVTAFDTTSAFGGAVVSNGDGTFTYTPAVNFHGSDSFTYTITDLDGDSSTATVMITVTAVNDVPVAANDSVITSEDNAVTTGNVLSNDNPGDEPTSIAGFDAVSANGGSVVNNGDGSFTYTPATNFNGSDSFTYTITDLDGETSTATVMITVAAVNDVPAAAGDSYTTAEETTVVTGNVLMNDGLGEEPTTITAFDATSVAGGTVVDNLDGTFTYTPAANFYGIDSFTYTISENDGETSMATVTITVTAVNDVPVASLDSFNTTEDTVVTTGSVLSNDELGDELTTITAFDSTSANGGTVVYNGDGSFTYAPPANYNGSDSFTYTITDSDGETSTATVAITVVPVNDVPVASADNYSTVEDTATTTGNVLANDSLGDGSTTITAFDAISANGGTVVKNGDDTFRYLPAAGFTGTDSFTYTITDQDGESTTATVTLTVAPASASEEEPLPNALTPSAGVSPPPDAGVPVPGNDDSDAPQPSDDDNDALFPLSEATSTARGSTGSEPPTEEESSVEESSGEETPTENVEAANETADEVDGNTPTDDALADTGQSQSQVQTPDSRPRVPEPRANGISGLNTVNKPPLMASPEFLAALDEIRAALDQNAPLAEEQLQVLAAGVTVTGVSLTAGSVTWAIRGGSLLTTLLAGIPAWKGFDPLPVVLTARPQRKAREQDKEKGEPDDMETKAARLFEADDEMPPAEEPAVKTS